VLPEGGAEDDINLSEPRIDSLMVPLLIAAL
jgi:hypothetical protein